MASARRRFRDFVQLDASLRSRFPPDSHLLASFPALPPRAIKLVVDHSRPEFCEARRQQLDMWLRRVWRFPNLAESSSLRHFLRLHQTQQAQAHDGKVAANPCMGSNAESDGAGAGAATGAGGGAEACEVGGGVDDVRLRVTAVRKR